MRNRAALKPDDHFLVPVVPLNIANFSGTYLMLLVQFLIIWVFLKTVRKEETTIFVVPVISVLAVKLSQYQMLFQLE